MPPLAGQMSDRKTVLLCYEAGAGRGHATKLATVARALWPEHPCQAILPRLDASDLLAPHCGRIDRGPFPAVMSPAPPRTAMTWAYWLLSRGFADPDILRQRFDWWCRALRNIGPGLVVADFAPTALMAARAMGVPAVAIGAPFFTIPSKLDSFPDFLPPEATALHGTVLVDAPPPDEAAMRDIINETLGPLGLPPLARLPEVNTADLELAAGIPLWDPYLPWRSQPLLMPLERLPPLRDRAGSEVFIYFSTHELKEPAIRNALRRMPYPARLVAPGLPEELARDLAANPKLVIEPAPLSHDRIVGRARVILCAGQAGTMSLAVLAGIPVLALPIDFEKLSNAWRAAEALPSARVLPRLRRSTETILDTMGELWARPDLAEAAGEDALRLRAVYTETAQEAYRRRMLPLLGHREKPPQYFLRNV